MASYNSKAASKKGNREHIPLYGSTEQEVLIDELLEAYATPRENIISRDQLYQRKQTQFAEWEETKRTAAKEIRNEETLKKIKVKQEALKKLYENVLSVKTEKEKKKLRKKSESDQQISSTASFHKMYAIYHDPNERKDTKMVRGQGSGEDALVLEIDEDGKSRDVHSLMPKILGATPVPPPQPPSKAGENDKLTEASSGKERSKFVLKKRISSSLKSKPPPLLDGTRRRTSREIRGRKDARYSEQKDRYSFDVDVVGPFLKEYLDPAMRPRMRNIGVQAMMADDIRKSGDDMGSQTDMIDIGSSFGWSEKRGSKSSNRSFPFTYADDDDDDDVERDGFGDEIQDLAGGDASSSNPSEVDVSSQEEEIVENKVTLERKESKRREAETEVRPRGYRDLDLAEPLPFVTFEAETHVTAHDLEREEAKSKGIMVHKDNILWPSCSEFDMDVASKRIEDYINRCWTIDPKWLFFIQPLEVYHGSFQKKYIFEVKFSIPSTTTPVPPATASVFFVFEIPLYAMKTEEVKVSYVLEGTRFAHYPGKIPFQDRWLWGIISDKLRVQKAVNF